MNILILESIAATPHLETSGEIAIREKKTGNDVTFCWIGYNLPWNDWELNWFYKLLGGSYEKKLISFCNLLKKNKIRVDNLKKDVSELKKKNGLKILKEI